MPILSSLLGALIGGKPEVTKPPPTQITTPTNPPPVQQATDIPPTSEKPIQQQQQPRPQQEYLVYSERESVLSPRSLKQLGLFAAGAGFLALSTTITRRAVTRRTLSALPRFYHPSHVGAMKQGNPDGAMIAAEALGLATLNVFAFGVMLTGGLSWAWDVSSVEDLRMRARQKLYGEAGAMDEDAEKQMEEWMAKVLGAVKREDADAEKVNRKVEGEKKE